MEGIYVFMGIDAIINELKSKFWVQFFNRRAELMELFHRKKHRQIQKLQNKFEGDKCFIIGNGPSLTTKDLEMIAANGYRTFASNRIYNLFDKTTWRPTFYACSDEKLYRDSRDIIDNLDDCMKFLPMDLYDKSNAQSGFYYFTRIPAPSNRKTPAFQTNLLKKFGEGNTITYHMMQLAAGMGFKEIYLLGVDFSYAISIGIDGKIVEDKSVKNYAWDNDQQPPNLPNIQWNYYAYQSALRESSKYGIKIFNATRGGKLEVFERVDIDVLLESAT